MPSGRRAAKWVFTSTFTWMAASPMLAGPIRRTMRPTAGSPSRPATRSRGRYPSDSRLGSCHSACTAAAAVVAAAQITIPVAPRVPSTHSPTPAAMLVTLNMAGA